MMLHELIWFESVKIDEICICLVFGFCWFCSFASTYFILLIKTTYEASNLWYSWCDCTFSRFRHITLRGIFFGSFFFFSIDGCLQLLVRVLLQMGSMPRIKSWSIFHHNNVSMIQCKYRSVFWILWKKRFTFFALKCESWKIARKLSWLNDASILAKAFVVQSFFLCSFCVRRFQFSKCIRLMRLTYCPSSVIGGVTDHFCMVVLVLPIFTIQRWTSGFAEPGVGYRTVRVSGNDVLLELCTAITAPLSNHG